MGKIQIIIHRQIPHHYIRPVQGRNFFKSAELLQLDILSSGTRADKIKTRTVNLSVDFHDFGCQLEAYGNEQVGDFSLIAPPGLAIFPSTSVGIPNGAVGDHNHEENKVKPGKWTPIRQLVMMAHGYTRFETFT